MSDASIATATGLPLRTVAAIRHVESGSQGPSAVRFEPHLFWRMKLGLPAGTSGQQIRAAMSPAQMAAVPYTPALSPPCRIARAASCVAAETNRAAFERAYLIDPPTAMRATSWGAFQVLGSVLLAIYPTPSAALAAFTANPSSVSDQTLVKWLHGNPRALEAARRGDWQTFVETYNGCHGDGCATYLDRFRRALSEPTTDAVGGGLLLLAALGGWWWWRRR